MRPDLRLLAAASLVAFSAGPLSAQGFRLEKQFDLAAGSRFELRSELGSVTVRGVAGQRASILVTSDRDDVDERYDIRFEQPAGRLVMTVVRKGGRLGGWFGNSGKARIAVDLPKGTAVELDASGGGIELSGLEAAVRARSSGGSVKVAGVHGEVSLSSSGGPVEARDVHGATRLTSSGGGVTAQAIDGTLFVDTSGGPASIDTVSGELTASSSGGGVQVAGAAGRVKAGSSGGPVRVGFTAGNSKGGEISSSGGGVTVTLDPAARLDVDAESSGGSVRADIPLTVHGAIVGDKLHGRLNGGGALLKLRSSAGGITIGAR
jgi:hypothetical protein